MCAPPLPRRLLMLRPSSPFRNNVTFPFVGKSPFFSPFIIIIIIVVREKRMEDEIRERERDELFLK